jgi:8-oxo-dGTP diphosphatase
VWVLLRELLALEGTYARRLFTPGTGRHPHVAYRALTGYVFDLQKLSNTLGQSSTFSTRIILVRHGRAGTKVGWSGDDQLRPLDRSGRQQAERLVEFLVSTGLGCILSSPYLRCEQTVEPIATKLGLRIESSFDLVPDAGSRAFRMVRELSAIASPTIPLLCTHGEVMGTVLAQLAFADGIELCHKPPGSKGCIWILDFLGGKLSSARYIAPVQVRPGGASSRGQGSRSPRRP